MTYRSLNADSIVQTAHRLRCRIAERFPDAGLGRVAAELSAVAEETSARLAHLDRPRWGIRIGTGFLTLLILVVALLAVSRLRLPASFQDLGGFVQVLESGINDVVFVAIAVAFLVTIETRLKRREALRAIHELRSLAHIVDMHQLTKDPDPFGAERSATASSPERALTPFELGRYLDYCSELLSVTSKVAALYAQRLNDPVVLAAVNEVETLTTGLSNKIWQKLVILGRALPGGKSSAAPSRAALTGSGTGCPVECPPVSGSAEWRRDSSPSASRSRSARMATSSASGAPMPGSIAAARSAASRAAPASPMVCSSTAWR
jgi:hypothetical protein